MKSKVISTEPKLDLYKEHKAEYATPKRPVLLEIGPVTYLAIEGRGEPGSQEFSDRISALYGMAFTVKMTRKFAGKRDYSVCKLEGQWWGDGGREVCDLPKSQWRWKLMIRTPGFVTKKDLAAAVAAQLEKGKTPLVRDVKLEPIIEGRCVQMLHVGPYEREQESIALMRSHAESLGLKFHGRHHEIYLSDPRRVAAERLRTLLRHPVTSL